MSSRRWAWIVIVAIVGFAIASTGAQADPESVSRLSFLIGEWKLDAEFAQADGTVRKSTAILVGRRTMDGRGVTTESRYPGGEGQPEFVGTATYVYNPRLEKVLGSGINSLGNVKQYEVRFDGDRVIVVQTGMQFQGRPGINRSTYHDIGPDGFKLSYDYSPDDGKTWQEATFRYTASRTK